MKSRGIARMSRFSIMLKAASRLSLKMILYRVKRIARDKLAPRFADAYAGMIGKAALGLPYLASTPSHAVSDLVAKFYCDEYRAHTDATRRGKIELFGRNVDFGSPSLIDWSRKFPEDGDHQLWRIKLAHLGFLSPLLIEGGAQERRVVMDVLDAFERAARFERRDCFDSYWFAYAVSHRVLCLTSGLLVARSRGDLDDALEARLKARIRFDVAFILANIEHELKNNHVERNLAALCLYFSHVETPPMAIVRRLNRDVLDIVRETILPDGALIERSAMYQALSVMALEVYAATPFLTEETLALVEARLAAARRVWAALTHPDGEISLFNDSWIGETPPAAHVITEKAPDGVSLFHDAGIARLASGGNVCLLDAAPIGPSWNPGHGHADFLAVEISIDGKRLIVDPGTSVYNSGEARRRERSAAAHNGPHFVGVEPVEFDGCFKVGSMAEARLIPASALSDLDMSVIGGRFARAGRQVVRLVGFAEGRGFIVVDAFAGGADDKRVSLLVPDLWHPVDKGGRHGFAQDGVSAIIEVIVGSCDTPSPDFWARRYGRREGATRLDISPAARGALSVSAFWVGGERDAPAGDVDKLLDRCLGLLRG